jgi:hypothetical protein
MTLTGTIEIAIGAPLALAIGVLALTPVIDAYRRTALRRLVPGVCGVLDAHGIDYWCDFGTLLGLYRERDIIRGDKDADLAILESELPRVLALGDAFRARGYLLTDRGGRARNVVRVYDPRTGYHVDIYPYRADGDLLRSLVASPQEDIPAGLVERRVPTSFLGVTVQVPDDIERVLRHRYGPAFATPRRGDKGATRPYSRLRSVLEDLQDNLLGIWSWIKGLR